MSDPSPPLSARAAEHVEAVEAMVRADKALRRSPQDAELRTAADEARRQVLEQWAAMTATERDEALQEIVRQMGEVRL